MLRLSFFLTYTTILADFLATSLILVNRWTAITMPINYKWVTKVFTENPDLNTEIFVRDFTI